uniref:Uncharacterized protein n=1 Tax=Anguilla anguilla TaxID=7936 RepID=A0A0E9USC9_ANGAN
MRTSTVLDEVCCKNKKLFCCRHILRSVEIIPVIQIYYSFKWQGCCLRQ